MTTNRSRLASPGYQASADPNNESLNPTASGEDNPTFSDNDENLNEIELETIEPKESDLTNLHVTFSVPSAIHDSHYRQDSVISTQPFAADEEEQASDEEVASAVSNKDDPTMSVLTFRSWFLGLLFTCILSFVNQFFWYRTSPLFVGTLVAQLLTYPLGKGMARWLPKRTFKIFRWQFSFNPGPFTIKEHCIITAMANATCVSLSDDLRCKQGCV